MRCTYNGKNNAITILPGRGYTTVGGELAVSANTSAKNAVLSTSVVYVGAEKKQFTAYTIDGNNYFKLREVAAALDFYVNWEGDSDTLTINTGAGYASEAPQAPTGYDVGNAMPNFTVDKIDGGVFKLSEKKGKPVFINIFATWCGPCMKEMPDIQKLYDKYGDSVEIIVIDLNEGKSTASAFAAKYSYTMPVGYADGLGTFDIEAIPDTFILDKNGVIQKIYVGTQDYNTFSGALDALLS